MRNRCLRSPWCIACFVLLAMSCRPRPRPEEPEPEPPAMRAHILVDQGSDPVADGVGAVQVLVKLEDGAGAPVRDVPVRLRVSGLENVVVQPSVTDENGIARGSITSTRPGVKAISVTVGGGIGPLAPVEEALVSFRLVVVKPSCGGHPVRSLPYAGYMGWSLAVGDLNDDGAPELIDTGPRNTLLIKVNDGRGVFPTSHTLTFDAAPTAIAVGDLDGDGKIDLAVAMSDSSVAILRGRGDASFGPPIRYPTNDPPSAITLGHADGDGRLDVATVGRTAMVDILFNRGHGQFAPPEAYAAGTDAADLVMADMDGDGAQDLVTVNPIIDSISVARNQGNRRFSMPVSYPAGSFPTSLTVADFDRDGRSDVAVAASMENAVSVLLNDGHGGFASRAMYPTGWRSYGVGTFDLDGDGALDLALASGSVNTVSVHRNRGDGTFAAPMTLSAAGGPLYPAQPSPSEPPLAIVRVADVDRDGRRDMIAGVGFVNVMRNTGDGGFATPRVYPVGTDKSQVGALGDIDGNGWPDVVATDFDEGNLRILINDGTGAFGPPIVTQPIGRMPIAVTLGDVDGDGTNDLAVTLRDENAVAVLLNGNDGLRAPVKYQVGGRPAAAVLVDLNGDGRRDLAVSNSEDRAVSVLMNQGNGSFGPQVRHGVAPDGIPHGIAAGDFNGDGHADLATANVQVDHHSVSILINKGDGSFEPQVSYRVSEDLSHVRGGTARLVVEDINRDGKSDVLVAPGTRMAIGVLVNRGDGTFAPLALYPAGVPGYLSTDNHLAVVDVNTDGRPDLVTNDGRAHVIRFGRDDGTFGPSSPFYPGLPVTLYTADLNLDGRPDFVGLGVGYIRVLAGACFE